MMSTSPLFLRTHKYEFFNNEWKKEYVSTEKQNKERQTLMHGDSPNTGQFWMSGIISFEDARISHYDVASNIVRI